MKNKNVLCCCILLLALSACKGSSDLETTYGIRDIKDCENEQVLKANQKGLIKDKGSVYCSIDENLDHIDQANAFVNAGYKAERINTFFQLSYYNDALTKRYISYDNGSMNPVDVVTQVNIGLDQPYFTQVDTIKNTNDPLLLINKYHKLPEGFVPDNLVKTPNACVIGEDYSCQSEEQFLVKEVADAFAKLTKAAKQDGIEIKAIASYRSYAYQKNLYDYYAQANGTAYADAYYARPGQSEHNSGFAVDIMMDDVNFNVIETAPNYDWLLAHMQDYGFILRYPEDKVDITGYQYESWHLRYVGVENAKKIKKSGLTLDEYLARTGS